MNLSDYGDEELFQLRVDIICEMDARGIKFSVGEIGERLAIEYFNNTPGLVNLKDAPVGTKNIDAISRNGKRYSIKTIQKGKKTGTVYQDKEDPDTQLFEFLLIVHLDERYKLKSIVRIDWKTFLEVRAWDKRMTAWFVPISKKRLLRGERIF